jgi:hypothetical protein
MTRIILDEALRRRLYGLNQPAELCDESGKVLARLIPVVDESAEPQLSADELERRRNEPNFSTAEVLSYLEQL